MQQTQTSVRQADETICFRCNATVKRNVGACPQCGGAIAEGPAQRAPDLTSPMPAVSPAGEDVIGAGRYVLNFFLAGLVGLGISYFLRKQGWLATWICAAIFVAIIVVITMTRPSG
jgi:hypothetical protein